MSSSSVTANSNQAPITYLLAKWWGFVLAAMYILYGGVKIVLSLLDRNYEGLWTPLLSVAIGLLLLIFAYGFRDRKDFGWYGEVGLNAAVLLMSLFSLRQYGAVVVLIVAGAALVLLAVPSTRACFPSRR